MKNLEDDAWRGMDRRGATIEVVKGFDWNRDCEALSIRSVDSNGIIAMCVLEWEKVQHDAGALLQAISDVIDETVKGSSRNIQLPGGGMTKEQIENLLKNGSPF